MHLRNFVDSYQSTLQPPEWTLFADQNSVWRDDPYDVANKNGAAQHAASD
jgi:hypothetical protein